MVFRTPTSKFLYRSEDAAIMVRSALSYVNKLDPQCRVPKKMILEDELRIPGYLLCRILARIRA